MGMIAFVWEFIISLTFSGSKPKVSSSISPKTGLAPTKRGALAVAIKVKEWTMTSSPWEILWASKREWSADVPELNVSAYLVPIFS